MRIYGGSFMQALAEAFRKGDPYNQARIKAAFADEWTKYQALAELRQIRTQA